MNKRAVSLVIMAVISIEFIQIGSKVASNVPPKHLLDRATREFDDFTYDYMQFISSRNHNIATVATTVSPSPSDLD